MKKEGSEYIENISSQKIGLKSACEIMLADQEAENPCAWRALWVAVITQALMDAGSNSKKSHLRKEKARAIAWLNSDTEDFMEVCINAGFEPDYVRMKAKEAIRNGCKWRKELSL